MDITVDTSAVMAVVLEEPAKKKIVALTQGADLLAPRSLPWEVGNALSSLMRRELISVGEAHQAVSVFESIPIRFVDVELGDVMEIIGRHKIWAYDAYSIRCARRFRTPLLSLDKNQCRIAELENITVLEVSS